MGIDQREIMAEMPTMRLCQGNYNSKYNHLPLLTDSLKPNKTFEHPALCEDFIQHPPARAWGLTIWLQREKVGGQYGGFESRHCHLKDVFTNHVSIKAEDARS